MIVCQYFLQGRCRFGQNCRFEHTYPNDDRGSRIAVNAQQLHDVLSRITEEVMMAERGGQWPLSCFAPIRGKPNFPGFEDISPEELRWKTYQAKANGTWDQCVNEIKELYKNVERMRNRITMPTKETLTLLVNVLKSKKELSPLRTTTSPVGTAAQPTSHNIFGSAQPSGQNIFASSSQPTSSQNIFGGSLQGTGSNVLGSATTGQNVFGTSTQSASSGNVLKTATQPASSQNVFGSTPSPSGLGNSTKAQGNIFGNTSFSGNVFGNSPQATGNIFGGSAITNVFGGSTTPSQSIFTPSTKQANVLGTTSFQKQNIFGGGFSQSSFSSQGTTTTQNIFSGPVTSSGTLFSSPSSQNVFSNFVQGTGQTPGVFHNQSSPFSQNSLFQSGAPIQSQSNAFAQGENIFKNQNTFGGNIFGTPEQNPESLKVNVMDSSVYSKMEDLTEEEVNAFKNTIFAFGKIPLKPPPREFCK